MSKLTVLSLICFAMFVVGIASFRILTNRNNRPEPAHYVAYNESLEPPYDPSPWDRPPRDVTPWVMPTEASELVIEWRNSNRHENVSEFIAQLSDDDFIDISDSGIFFGYQFPIGFVSDTILYHRPSRIQIGTAMTQEEAYDVIVASFNSPASGNFYSAELLAENDLYFIFRVCWYSYLWSDDSPMFNSANDLILRGEHFERCRYSSIAQLTGTFLTDDKNIIHDILDTKYAVPKLNRGDQVLYSKLVEVGEMYVYTVYTLVRVFGSWGINDALYTERTHVSINKHTGAIVQEETIWSYGDSITIYGTDA